MRQRLHFEATLDLPLDVTTQAIAIMGQRRAGTGTTARRLTEQVLSAHQQVVVVDPKCCLGIAASDGAYHRRILNLRHHKALRYS